ncbi:SOS response-associated peptidase [Leisingera daeponensis]|nr:SOS response-associated peptidase [Leisingera daeponensis]
MRRKQLFATAGEQLGNAAETRRDRLGLRPVKKSKKTGKPNLRKAVNNARDDKALTSRFWKASFEERRCLILATSFCEAKGRNPAVYHSFGVDRRSPFCFAGIPLQSARRPHQQVAR